MYDFPNGGIEKPYGHWLKALSRRAMMNSCERWLRLMSPKQSACEDGNSMNQAVAMTIDSANATISGVVVSSTMFVGKNMRIMVPFKDSGEKNLKGNNFKGKSTEEPAHIRGDKESVEEMEIGLIVNEAKRRRSQDGLLINVGNDREESTQFAENQVVSKNGPAVGPVIQAH